MQGTDQHSLAVASTMKRAEELVLESPTFLKELKKLIRAFRKLDARMPV